MTRKNAFYAQSGGVTAVITSACGVLQTARQHSEEIGKVYAGRNGIIGALTEDLNRYQHQDPNPRSPRSNTLRLRRWVETALTRYGHCVIAVSEGIKGSEVMPAIRQLRRAERALSQAIAARLHQCRRLRHHYPPFKDGLPCYVKLRNRRCPLIPTPSRLLKNWAARLTLEHEFDSCAVERAAGGIHARFGYTDR